MCLALPPRRWITGFKRLTQQRGEPMKAAQIPERTPSQEPSRPRDRITPVDGIIFSGRPDWQKRTAGSWVTDTWVLAHSDSERIADFFLQEEAGPAGGEHDPAPWVCRSIRPDGTVVLGCVNLSDDHFLSE